MKLNEVKSSNILGIGYEDNSLYVKYKSGTIYRYNDFPKNLYESLLMAESKGRFMSQMVKGKYTYERVKEGA